MLSTALLSPSHFSLLTSHFHGSAQGTLIVLVIVPVRPPASVTLRVMVLEPPVENVKVITFVVPMMAPLGRVHWKDTIPTSSVEPLASNVQAWLVLQAAVNLATGGWLAVTPPMKPMKSNRFGVPVPADVISPVVALVLMALAT